MPEAQSITEAILRRLGGFAQNVGGQIQTNQDINRELARRAGVDQQAFEAQQLQRSIQNELAQSRLDIGQQRADLDFARFSPAAQRITGAVSPEPLPTPSIKEQEAELFATDPEAYYRHIGRLAELKRAPEKGRKAPTITGLQRKRLIDERVGEQQEDILGRSIATDVGGLRQLSQEGDSDPDRMAFNLLREFEQTGSAEARQAINDSIQAGLIFPELGIAGQPPEPQREALRGIEANIAGFLQDQQAPVPVQSGSQQLPGPKARITPEIEQWGQSEFHNWNQLSPEQKFLLAKQNRKL